MEVCRWGWPVWNVRKWRRRPEQSTIYLLPCFSFILRVIKPKMGAMDAPTSLGGKILTLLVICFNIHEFYLSWFYVFKLRLILDLIKHSLFDVCVWIIDIWITWLLFILLTCPPLFICGGSYSCSLWPVICVLMFYIQFLWEI